MVLLTSCSDLHKPEQVELLGELLNDVEDVKEGLDGVDDSLAVYIDRVNELDELLKKSYSNDTLNFDIAKSIDILISLKEEFPELKKEMFILDSLLGVKEIAIVNLNSDIASGSGDRSKYDEFLSFERDEVNVLKENVDALMDAVEFSIDGFNTMYPKVNDYIHLIEVK